MGELTVTAMSVPGLIDVLRKREWLIPKFQRDFVWTVSDILELVLSIFESRPIGMATLWEQTYPLKLALAPISITDYDPETKQTVQRELEGPDTLPPKTYAILDGRQRCTAITMAFGGLKARDRRYRYSGRFYLDVLADDESNRVRFEKEIDVQRRKLTSDAQCISQGLFPLTSNIDGEQPLGQWMRYLQAIRDPKFYEGGKLPSAEELQRRDGILKKAFEGIVGTRLAVYVVPDQYGLAEICEIFETLNTTGTKVSAVDLVHSYLYADSTEDSDRAIELRQWIRELGQKDGAIGWANPSERPELIAQLVTACYLALENRPPPREGPGLPSSIASLKAGDLLATPYLHWKSVIHNDALLAEYLGDFQKIVAGGYFPYTACPYPISAGIYVGLRWHYKFDGETRWGRQEIDSLYRAFFWRNALSGRYDQGFLTKMGTDLKQLRQWLDERGDHNSVTEWAAKVQTELDAYMPLPPDKLTLIDYLTDDRQRGAIQKALVLPMLGGVKEDLVDPSIALSYPSTEVVELHHIYPKGWCRNSMSGDLAQLLEPNKAGRNWVDSAANLIPLSRKSNNIWKAKIPGQLLVEKHVTYEQVQRILKAAYIDKESFRLLLEAPKHIGEFWKRRAEAIATDLVKRMSVVL